MPKNSTKTTKTNSSAVIDEKTLIKALDHLFTKGGWDIPDDAIEGRTAARVNQLFARVEHLTREVAALSRELRGEPPSGRVDAVAEAKAEKKPAKK